jgi:16S rRNA (guanine1207-N2)-methyltransferase
VGAGADATSPRREHPTYIFAARTTRHTTFERHLQDGVSHQARVAAREDFRVTHAAPSRHDAPVTPPSAPRDDVPSLDALLARLRRRPDVEAPELRAWDAADRYLLDTAAPLLAAHPDAVAVIDDTHGALTLGALTLGARGVRVHQDAIVAERALAANAADLGLVGYTSHELDAVVTADTRLVLLRLPRALESLDRIARAVARRAHPAVVVVAGNMVKHMTTSQNDVLAACFGRVDVSHARGKARLLTAQGPREVAEAAPGKMFDPKLSLHVVAHGGVFAAGSIDIGTRALLAVWDSLPPYESAIDLACGTGVLATMLARRTPTARVIACDVSAAAVDSARRTAAANGVTVETLRDDGLSCQPDASADLVVLNPPFHVGAAVHTGVAQRLFADAARVLRPGGALWCVWNTPLRYTPALTRTVGPTREIAAGGKFTVTASVRPIAPTR